MGSFNISCLAANCVLMNECVARGSINTEAGNELTRSIPRMTELSSQKFYKSLDKGSTDYLDSIARGVPLFKFSVEVNKITGSFININVMCYARISEALMPLTNGMLSDKKLRKVLVLLYVCKKQSVLLLIQPILKISLPVALLSLNSFPLWAFLGYSCHLEHLGFV
jgi:hypothetical protein